MIDKKVGLSGTMKAKTEPKSYKKNPINGTKFTIAISSAKGGVWKSTFATNLALALKIIDGASRAAEVAIAGLLSDIKIINNIKIKKRPIKNSTNQVIGSMKWIC